MKKSITIIFACIFLWACNSKENNSQEKIEVLEAKVEQKQQQKKEKDLEKKELELQQKEEALRKKEQNIQTQETQQQVVQNETYTAVINDPDGYTNVRKGKGTQYPVVDVIYDNQTFEVYANTINDKWCLVYNPNSGIKGYMHKSRITIQ